MRNFHCERKLEAAVLAYITNFMNSKKNEDRLLGIFKELDTDNNGVLTVNELKEGFKEYLGENIMFEEEMEKII